MKTSGKERGGEALQKKYATLIKKTSTEDLRDMLSILLCDPEVASVNLFAGQLDIEKLDKKERDYHIKNSAKLQSFDDQRFKDLHSKLDKKFHIFEKEKFSDPALGTIQIFPKVSLLIETIKSTLNLRESGKELPDDQRVTLIECFTSDRSDKDYKIVINGDYKHPLKVRRSIKIWDMFMELVENGSLDRNKTTTGLYDYLNYNANNLITSNTKYPLQKIIEQRSYSYEPLFKSAIYTEKALTQRQNNLENPT